MSDLWQSERDPGVAWRILERLGAGGQGETWRVTREPGGGTFVLKVLHRSHADLEAGLKATERFEREVAVLASLDHPGLPRLVDRVRDEAGNAGFIQTLVAGETVAAFTARAGRLDAATLTRFAHDLLAVLDNLHTRVPPVLHRDLSPRNVLLDPTPGGRASVIDFGGAVPVGKAAPTGSVTLVGTFATMAPEHILGQASEASDLYSLGVTLTSLASGRTPEELPQDPHSGAVVVRAVVTLPEPLPTLLEGLTRAGLAERLPSARAALGVLDGLPWPPQREALPPRPPSPLGRALRRHWPWAVPAAVMVGGWVTSQLPAEREVATLGGWFSGHGGLVSKITATFLGDPAAITSGTWLGPLTWDADGGRIVSGAARELRLWDVSNAQQMAHVSFDTSSRPQVLASAMSADGRHLAFATERHVEVWEVAGSSARQLARRDLDLDHDGPIAGLFLRGLDDVRLVRLEGRALTVREVMSARLLVEVPLDGGAGGPVLARVTGDGAHVVLVEGLAVHRLALDSGARLGTTRLEPTREPPNALAVDASGETFALAYRDAIEVWRAGAAAPRAAVTIDYGTFFDRPDHLALSHDGTALAFGQHARVVVHDSRSGARRFDLGGHDGHVGPVAFSPDGRTLAAAASDGVIRLRDVGL